MAQRYSCDSFMHCKVKKKKRTGLANEHLTTSTVGDINNIIRNCDVMKCWEKNAMHLNASYHTLNTLYPPYTRPTVFVNFHCVWMRREQKNANFLMFVSSKFRLPFPLCIELTCNCQTKKKQHRLCIRRGNKFLAKTVSCTMQWTESSNYNNVEFDV